MANEEPKDATQEDWGSEDEFAVRLGWADARDRGPAPGSVHVVDQWGTPWGDASSDDVDRPGTGPWEAPSPDVDQPEAQDLGVRLAELLVALADLLERQPLEELRTEIATLRSEVTALSERPPAPMSAAILEPVLNELGALRAELVALKRRTALRAAPGAQRSAEEAEEIARLVAEHLAARPSKRSRRR